MTITVNISENTKDCWIRSFEIQAQVIFPCFVALKYEFQVQNIKLEQNYITKQVLYLIFIFFIDLFFRQFAWVQIHWLSIQPGPTMLFHNQVIILCKFLQLRLRHLELWEWIRLWCHPITHLVKGQPNQDGPQDFCEITWKNKLLHIMFQILVMNELGIRNPGFGKGMEK